LRETVGFPLFVLDFHTQRKFGPVQINWLTHVIHKPQLQALDVDLASVRSPVAQQITVVIVGCYPRPKPKRRPVDGDSSQNVFL
jgi:hypothetical protein